MDLISFGALLINRRNIQRIVDLEFEVRDNLFLEVSPMRSVMRYGKKGKLDVFYMSILKKYLHDFSHVLSYESLDVDPKLTYEEKPVEILGWKDKVLRNNVVPLVKVL